MFGVIGSYFVQRRLKAKKDHEETVRKLYGKLSKLRSMLFTTLLVSYGGSGESLKGLDIYVEDIHALANEIKIMAGELDRYGLKKRVMKAMAANDFDSKEDMEKEITEALKGVREEAYPVLDEVKRENRHIEVTLRESKDGRVERGKKWGGPATFKFLERAEEMGVPRRTEEDT